MKYIVIKENLVVTNCLNHWGERKVVGVFNSKEEAEKICDSELKKDFNEAYEDENFTLDDYLENVDEYQDYKICINNFLDGDIYTGWYSTCDDVGSRWVILEVK